MMLSPPNKGSQAASLHVNDGDMSDGDGAAAEQLIPDSEFLRCLNNAFQKDPKCKTKFLINESLQNRQGINPGVPCVIVAGDVRDLVVDKTREGVGTVSKMAQEAWGWATALIRGGAAGKNNSTADKDTGEDAGQSGLGTGGEGKGMNSMPQGDALVSLESQLIDGIPYVVLPYLHGIIQRPSNFEDERYQVMKTFILNGQIPANRH
jgi:hypothetical protein